MYSKKEVFDKIIEVGHQLHHFAQFNEVERDGLITDVHRYIANSDITYTEAYCLVKRITRTREEFNGSMGRIRETIYRRDKC